MKIKWHYILLVSILFSCKNKQTQETPIEIDSDVIQLSAEQFKMADIVLGEPDTTELTTQIKARGQVDVNPQENASVSLAVEGSITNIAAVIGSRVSKGDVLAEYYSKPLVELQESYIEKYYAFQTTKANFERVKVLDEEKISAGKELVALQHKYHKDLAMLKLVEEQLRFYGVMPEEIIQKNITYSFKLRSPITGVIQDVNTNIGAYASPNDILFKLFNPKGLVLVLHVFERDISLLKVGQEVNYRLSNVSNEDYSARIETIGGSVDNAMKSLTVKARLINTPSLILPGLFVTSDIMVNSMRVLALPETAIFKNSDTDAYVFEAINVNDNWQFKTKRVKTGLSSKGMVEISFNEPLNSSSKIVTQGGYYLKSKQLLLE